MNASKRRLVPTENAQTQKEVMYATATKVSEQSTVTKHAKVLITIVCDFSLRGTHSLLLMM